MKADGNRVCNIGIVGSGWISENAYLPALLKNTNVKIVSVYDTDYIRAEKLADQVHYAKAYKDYDLFLKSDIVGVIICTPNATHKDCTVKALQQGKHVLCEKPVAVNVLELMEIKKIIQETGLLYVPGFVNRYREDVNKLRQIITSGLIGDVKRVEGCWIRENGIPRPGSWFTEKSLSGGGALIDLGSHIIDICLLLGGNTRVARINNSVEFCYDNHRDMEAKWFEGDRDRIFMINVESSAKAEMILINNVEVLVELSWNKSAKNDYTQFKVYGTKGKVELNTLFGFSTQTKWEQPNIKVMADGKPSYNIPFEWDDLQPVVSFERLCNYFVQSIFRGETTELEIEDGIRTVQTIDLIYQGGN